MLLPDHRAPSRCEDPHRGQPLHQSGAPAEKADAVVILMHGRGATAADILELADVLNVGRVCYLAPQAAGRTWYPNRFIAPIEENEPALSSALGILHDLVQRVEEIGIPAPRIFLVGFSQGGCVALEFAARNPRRYGGVVGLSSGLIGPDVSLTHYRGSLEGTPVLVACSDRDPHIPLQRVHDTVEILRVLGGRVQEAIYPGMGHTIHADEIEQIRYLLHQAISSV